MPELNEKGKLEDVISLRCKYCGAPLDCKVETKELIRCNSCGTTQKMIDARAFLEQIMGHVYSWVSAAIPSGFDLSRSENVDPIARHNIFINNVKPILETEYREYKFNSMNLFTNTLLILPFKTDTSIQPLNKASDVFEFNAKIKSIVPLAINDESKKLISEVIGLSTAYAYYLNNLDLISNEKLPERFNFMASNFLEAAKMLEKNEKFIPLYERSNGLNNAALAIRYLLDGNIYTAKSYIEKSLQNFGSAKTTLMSNFDLGIMFQAIEKEILVGKAIGYMITAAERDPSGSPLHTVSLIENMIRILSRQETYNHGQWGSYLKDISRCEEIFKWVQDSWRWW